MFRVLARLTVLAVAASSVVAVVARPAAAEGSYPQTMADYDALLAQVNDMGSQYYAAATGQPGPTPDPEALIALVPNSVLSSHPELAPVIRGAEPIIAFVPPSHSGPYLPGCPAAGRQLLSGFPPPYGYFPINPTNNWCTPNGPDNGCTYFPDTAFFYDFRAACRQHDLGYRWVPTGRAKIDNQLLKDALADCNKRSYFSRPLCYTTAGIIYGLVVAFAAFAYGSETRAGYNAPLPIDPLQAAPPCGQPTHVWIETFGATGTLHRNNTIALTGVVRASSRIRFDFFDASGNLVADHLTYFADAGCVVHHDAELFSISRLPLGTVTVKAVYARWEDNLTLTRTIGTFQIAEGGGTTTCAQASHTWVELSGAGTTLPQGYTLYLTGVVKRQTSIMFRFYDSNGQLVASHLTAPSGSNCVVAHEPETFNTSALPIGVNTVESTYTEWETDHPITLRVATLTITA